MWTRKLRWLRSRGHLPAVRRLESMDHVIIRCPYKTSRCALEPGTWFHRLRIALTIIKAAANPNPTTKIVENAIKKSAIG